MNGRHLLAACLILIANAGAFAESTPQGTVLDSRVRTLVFNENQVYKIAAYYGYQIDIELADNEEMRTVAAGDTVGWQIVSAGAHLFIKPMARNARTNLSVITSKRTYLFELVAESANARAEMAYLVRFKYPQGSVVLSSRAGTKNADAAAFNFDYKIKGDKSVRPSRVFDDGLFTFFQFSNPRNTDLPAVFWVSPDGQESLVNYRMDGAYMVVERVGEKFVLRSGDEKATVSNKLRLDPAPDSVTDAPWGETMSETTPNLTASPDPAGGLGQIPSIVGGSPKKSLGLIAGFFGLMVLVALIMCRSPHPKDRTDSANSDAAPALTPPAATASPNIPFDAIVTRPTDSRMGGESLLDIRRKSPMVIFNKQGSNAPVNPDTTPGGESRSPNAGVPLPKGFSPSLAESVQASLLGERDNLIAQGKLIDAVLETSIDSDHPGMLRALVSHDVYSDTGGNVLLPRGSRLIGQYDSAVAKGQNRVFVLWQRVIRPDGVDVQLGSPGTDPLGGSGIEGSVNYHFWEMFGAATLLSVIGGAASTVGVNPLDQNNSASQLRENITNGFNNAAGNVLQQFTQIKPTIKVRQGIEIKVFVARDVRFDPALVGGQEYQVIQ